MGGGSEELRAGKQDLRSEGMLPLGWMEMGLEKASGCLCSGTLQPSRLDQGTCSSRRDHLGVMLGSEGHPGHGRGITHPHVSIRATLSHLLSLPQGLCWPPLGLGALALPSSHQQVPRLASPLQPSASEPPAQIYCHALKPQLSARVSMSRRPLIDLFYLPLAKALWPRPRWWHKGLPKALGAPLAHPSPA